jgi:hypothetical protein
MPGQAAESVSIAGGEVDNIPSCSNEPDDDVDDPFDLVPGLGSLIRMGRIVASEAWREGVSVPYDADEWAVGAC